MPDGYDVKFDEMGDEWERISVFYDRLFWWNRYLLITAYDILVIEDEIVTSLSPTLLWQIRGRQFDQGKSKIEFILTNM